MDRCWLGINGCLVLFMALGCGSGNEPTGPQPGTGASSDESADSTSEPERSAEQEQIVQVAREFLDAVIAGDSQQALEKMTPEGQQQISSSGKAFSPPSWETATFRIGEVRKPSEDQALVQCYFNESSPDGMAQEEMCCMLKHSSGDWGVSGVAFQVSPAQPPYILNFEEPPQTGPTQQQLVEEQPATSGQEPGGSPAAAADPARTAQQPQPPTTR